MDITEKCRIRSIKPSIFTKNGTNGPEQMMRISVSSPAILERAEIIAECGNAVIGRQKYSLSEGGNAVEFFIGEFPKPREVSFKLFSDGIFSDSMEITVVPPRHWVVHVVQLSHHDLGYTDLASNVWKEQAQHLNYAIEHAKQTNSYPDDAKFRIVIEQAWSLDSFFKTAPKGRRTEMIRLLQNGRFEMTSLYGNMITELCGHETLVRTAYHSAKLGRRYNIPVTSAEHNDVPGISWGLSEVLANIGVKIFCPGLPLYYSWGETKFRSFWDEKKIFGRENSPGAFWWETPSKKRVLFWCNNQGCGGGSDGALPQLESELEKAAANGYPYSIMRFPVGGGHRDNSPYIGTYAHTIKNWNEKWAYPHLICSTNAKFYDDFSKILPDGLPIWRGELPGQDYPSGATSTVIPASANRRNHAALTNAEKLASAASLHTDYTYQSDRIGEAYEETMRHDEHTWGFHFPSGAAARAAEWEKALRAFRAEAFAAEVRDKSMAHISDKLKLKSGELYLVAFNQSSWSLTAPITVNMREADGTGSVMVPAENGVLRGVPLDYRWHAYPGKSYFESGFDLIDETTGESVVYDLAELDDVYEPADFAAQRMGLGQGTRRYGIFEDPGIIKKDIHFVATGIPAHGYKAYRLNLGKTQTSENADKSENAIENEYYKITADPKTMRIASVYDKEANRELVDPNGGDFYRFAAREKNSANENIQETRVKLTVQQKNAYSKIRIDSFAAGHPIIRHNIILYKKVKNIYFETSVFKDPTPLLNAHLAFPLKAENPRFCYESALSVMEPAKDYFPGAYSDAIAVQNWVKIEDGDYHILWSSIDAPIVGFCKLWPGYVSPAHRCFTDESFRHDPQTEEDYQKNGWIFSQLSNNNFGTNFSVSQTGLAVFRYCLTSGRGAESDFSAAKWGAQASLPKSAIFTDRANENGIFEPCGKFLECENPEVNVLNWKLAENGKGHIVRLWNASKETQSAAIAFAGCAVTSANLTNMVETDLPDGEMKTNQDGFVVEIGRNEIKNVRVQLKRR
ncbi:MAG: glycosyl hydrolase-related protein [Oscillospiraceae bacterium]|nr:glycosyl hydrolase-related protein [Oscillospiraceae bacterium]